MPIQAGKVTSMSRLMRGATETHSFALHSDKSAISPFLKYFLLK